jgi:hypothetical protein
VGIVYDAVLRQDHSVVKLLKQRKTLMYVERITEVARKARRERIPPVTQTYAIHSVLGFTHSRRFAQSYFRFRLGYSRFGQDSIV